MTFVHIKDPQEVLDYTINYSRQFAKTSPVDQIATSSWSITPDVMNIDAESIIAPDKAVAKVSGTGKLESRHYLTNTITTIGGRTYQRTIRITLRNL